MNYDVRKCNRCEHHVGPHQPADGRTPAFAIKIFEQQQGWNSIYSRYGLHARRVAKRPSTSKATTALLPPLPLRLLPGGANQFPGGSFTR